MAEKGFDLYIYEDNEYENFFPLAITRPVFELICGAFNSKQRILKILNIDEKDANFVFRKSLSPIYNNNVDKLKLSDKPVLFINSRVLDVSFFLNYNFNQSCIFKSQSRIAGFYLDCEFLSHLKNIDIETIFASIVSVNNEIQTEILMADYIWDLVKLMPDVLIRDFTNFYKSDVKGDFSFASVIHGDSDLVYCSEGSEIHPFVVIDTKQGPVIIEKGAVIHPFSRIEGPSYIGTDAVVLGAKVRSGTYIGQKCRVGGEIENSIMFAHSNKYHEGFLGHAYIGEWVNLGALTTNSDLKNNYSHVDVYLNGKKINTNNVKIGSFIGDHSKTSIGCLLNTGTYIGVMANLMSGKGLLPKYIPDFSNFNGEKFIRPFPLKSLLETAKTVKSRRDKDLNSNEQDFFTKLFEDTAVERKKYFNKS